MLDLEGAASVDENALFAAYERLRAIEAKAQLKTKAARRAQQRRSPPTDSPGRAAPASPLTPEPLLPSQIRPFEELEDLS
jgi:putative transposase